MRRSAWIGALAFAAWSVPAPAETPPDIDACLAAHEKGQILRKHDKLLEAQREFASCAVDACPKLARDDCSTWLGEVEAEVPTILLGVKDSSGAALPSARCTLDAAPIDAPMEGRAIAVDEGAHALHCEAAGLTPIDRTFATARGERDRRIDVVLEPPTPPRPSPSNAPFPSPFPAPSTSASPPTTPPTTPPPPSLLPVFISGGVALASFATFAYLGASGVSTEDDLRATCKPNCSESSVSAVRARYNVADAFLGAGVLATGVTAWLYFSRRAPSPTDARIGLQALAGGGGARVAVPF